MTNIFSNPNPTEFQPKYELYGCTRLSLKACSNVILEYVAVLGECCPTGRDPSLNLLIMAFVCDAASLLQVDVVFNFLNY